MTMQLEGDLSLGRVQTRRWVSIVAFVIPVAAFVLLMAWFVRVYIVPPTVDIPSLIRLASAPQPAPVPAAPPNIEPPQAPMAKAEPPQPPQPPLAKAEPPAQRPLPERREPASALPMFATLAAVPPATGSAPTLAFPNPPREVSAAAAAMPSEQAAVEASEPMAGPVPLPHAKPQPRVALATNQIPLPRPRPAESAPPPDDLPAVDRHSLD